MADALELDRLTNCNSNEFTILNNGHLQTVVKQINI